MAVAARPSLPAHRLAVPARLKARPAPPTQKALREPLNRPASLNDSAPTCLVAVGALWRSPAPGLAPRLRSAHAERRSRAAPPGSADVGAARVLDRSGAFRRTRVTVEHAVPVVALRPGTTPKTGIPRGRTPGHAVVCGRCSRWLALDNRPEHITLRCAASDASKPGTQTLRPRRLGLPTCSRHPSVASRAKDAPPFSCAARPDTGAPRWSRLSCRRSAGCPGVARVPAGTCPANSPGSCSGRRARSGASQSERLGPNIT